jgi:adenylate kinase family enzyme
MPGKFAFIMRGVPGSGKSTTAKMLAGDHGVIHAVDAYHTDEKGNFLWSDEKAEERYQKNFEEFVM